MNKHEFNFALFPQNILLGISCVNYEIEEEGTNNWLPALAIEVGFIFFTFSYINTRIDL